MTQEQKARAYDEIREKAKVIKECSTNTEVVGYIEELFPEFAESEDERIRKDIITHFKAQQERLSTTSDTFTPYPSWIAWLEKQGEQGNLCDKCRKEQPSHSCQDITELGRCAVEHEQKSAEWSEEDEDVINHLLAICAGAKRYRQFAGCLQEDITKYQTWLKSLRPQSQWKPSEEQLTWLYRAADDASKDSRMKQILNELLSDLKKLTK